MTETRLDLKLGQIWYTKDFIDGIFEQLKFFSDGHGVLTSNHRN